MANPGRVLVLGNAAPNLRHGVPKVTRRPRQGYFLFALWIIPCVALTTPSLADSDNIHPVRTACSDFTDYVNSHQAILDNDVAPDGSSFNELEGVAGWNFQLGGVPALTFTVRNVDKSERFHCRCSGKDVESYERDCPVGVKCFYDFLCPPGEDCENHPCVSADLPQLNITTNRVDSGRFHWVPSSITKQCKPAMDKYNASIDAHELGHAHQYRQDIDQWIASHPASSFHRYKCGSNVEAIKQQLADEITQDLQTDIDLLTTKLNLDTAQFHKEHGETVSPPDCSCPDK